MPVYPTFVEVVANNGAFDPLGLSGPITLTIPSGHAIPEWVVGGATNEGLVLMIVTTPYQFGGNLGPLRASIVATDCSDDAPDPGGTGEPGNAYLASDVSLGYQCTTDPGGWLIDDASPPFASFNNGMLFTAISITPFWGLPDGTTVTINVDTSTGPLYYYSAYLLRYADVGANFLRNIAASRNGSTALTPTVPDCGEIPHYDDAGNGYGEWLYFSAMVGGITNDTLDGFTSVVSSGDSLTDASGLWTQIGYDAVDGAVDSAGLIYKIWQRHIEGTEDSQAMAQFVESAFVPPTTNDQPASMTVGWGIASPPQPVVAAPVFNHRFRAGD